MIKLLALIIVPILLLSGCGSYSGFTRIIIEADSFKANCGPLNHFEGEMVDASFERDCEVSTGGEL